MKGKWVFTHKLTILYRNRTIKLASGKISSLQKTAESFSECIHAKHIFISTELQKVVFFISMLIRKVFGNRTISRKVFKDFFLILGRLIFLKEVSDTINLHE